MEQVIIDELKGLGSRLAEMPKLRAYEAPDAAYFLELAPALTEGAIQGEAPDPALRFTTGMPFSVPDQYFDSLAADLSFQAMLTESSPAADTFDVPPGYFSGLPAQLLAAAKQGEPGTKKARRVSFPVLRRSLPWLAAAAMMAGVYFGLSPRGAVPGAETRALTALATINSDSLGNYVDLHSDEFDQESLEASLTAGQVTDVREAVSQIPNDELESYLNDDDPDS